MKIDLKHLLDLQQDLNNLIIKKYNIKSNVLLINKQFLSFFVELGELANETRCFKYWSNKSPSPKTRIQEEYADGLHFLLTLGLLYKWKTHVFNIEVSDLSSSKEEITKTFNNLFYLSSYLYENMNNASIFFKLLEQYLYLGLQLKLSKNSIMDSYIKKHTINHKRVNNNY